MSVTPLGTVLDPAEPWNPDDTVDVRVAVVDRDGSRRIMGNHHAGAVGWPDGFLSYATPGGIFILWGPVRGVPIDDGDLRTGRYLPYPPADGIPIPAVLDPVNPIPYLLEWDAHVTRGAHGFDLAPASSAWQAADAAAKAVCTKLVHGLVGVAWWKIELWRPTDPTVLIPAAWPAATFVDLDGETKPVEWLWQNGLEDVRSYVDAVCDLCANAETYARWLVRNVNAAAYSLTLNAAQLHTPDRSGQEWVPGTLVREKTKSSQPVSAWHDGWKLQFDSARDYYDAVIAHREAPHGH